MVASAVVVYQCEMLMHIREGFRGKSSCEIVSIIFME